MIAEILNQIETKRRMLEPKECEDGEFVSENVRDLGLENDEIDEIKRSTRSKKVLFIHIELENGYPWITPDDLRSPHENSSPSGTLQSHHGHHFRPTRRQSGEKRPKLREDNCKTIV